MWTFLKTIELLFILSFILGFLAKGMGEVFKSLEAFLKAAEPTLAGMGETELNPVSSLESSIDSKPDLISLLQEGGYIKDGKVDAVAIDQAIQTSYP